MSTSKAVELPAEAEVETTTGLADDRAFYGVVIPGLGELYSYDRAALVDYLTRAAAQVAADPDPTED